MFTDFAEFHRVKINYGVRNTTYRPFLRNIHAIFEKKKNRPNSIPNLPFKYWTENVGSTTARRNTD